MPTIGSFHRIYWRARAGGGGGGGGGQRDPSMYPAWQASVLSVSFFGVPWEYAKHLWELVCWYWRLWKLLRLSSMNAEQLAVLVRVSQALHRPEWATTRQLVRACATSSAFHRPEQWVEYSRALKANAGQAQNVFRHVKVVMSLKAAHPELTNPEAHLLAELGYQGFATRGHPDRRVVRRHIVRVRANV